MTAFISTLGNRYGSLVVIDESIRGRMRKVLCRCDCGREELFHVQRLRAGKYVACSHCVPRNDPSFKSVLGKKFGKLLVIDEQQGSGRKRKVLCRCDCGRETMVHVGGLRSGRSATCGSCNRSMDRFKSVLGEKYGHLTVIEEHEVCRNRRVKCRCICGEIVTPLLMNLKRGQIKSCGCVKDYDHTNGLIYYLLDPSTRAIRYIGQTVQKPGVRLSNHIYNRKAYGGRQRICEEKHKWFDELKPQKPELFIAEFGIPVSELGRRERQHIDCQRANGADLLNIHHVGYQSA